MIRPRIAITVALGAMVSSTACSSFTASGDPLNQAEVSELAGAIVGQGFPGVGGVGAAPTAPAPGAASAATAEKVTINLNDSGPCESGGTVALTGTLTADVNQETHTGTLEYNLTISPNGCVITTEAGATLTLTGDPNVKGEGNLEWSQTGFNGDLKYSGKILWTGSDGRSGACGVDLHASFNLTGGTGANASAGLTGSVCGVSVERSVSVAT